MILHRGMICCIAFLTLCSSLTFAQVVFETQPRIVTQDGHLLLFSGRDRNITLHTSGRGYVNLNNENLASLAKMARDAADITQQLHSGTLQSLEQSLQSVASTVLGPQGLQERIYSLERALHNGSIGNTGTALRRRVLLLSRRISNAERKIRNMRTLLATNECNSNPCENGGSCIDKYNGFFCQCPPNWQGETCNVDINECARFAGTDLGCQNGATCQNTPGSYQCVCTAGWYGVHCTQRSNDCSSASSTELCGHGICVNQSPSGGRAFKCICDQGWTTDSTTGACTQDVDECSSNTRPACSMNPPVQCVNVPGSFYCGACPRGYTGNGYYCQDIDECMIDNGGCSKNPLVPCSNTQGSSMCGPCPPGYQGDGRYCSFVGICAVNNGDCHPLARCIDNPRVSQTYRECICREGYTGSGMGPSGCTVVVPGGGGGGGGSGGGSGIVVVNPCDTNPCVHGSCRVLTPTTYRCDCLPGYGGERCDMAADPCASLPCQHGGTCVQDPPSGYHCSCTATYTGQHCEQERQSCGGVFNVNEGETKELAFPNSTMRQQYRPNQNCAWVLITNSSLVLQINFTRFDIEHSPQCSYDWLQIHDGRNTGSQILGRFCGTSIRNFTSTHNTLYFWFHSDHSNSNEGFTFQYRAVPPECGSIDSFDTHGTLASPGSPGSYPNNRDCTWILFGPYGKRIQFHFYNIQIEPNANCSNDYLEIYDGWSYDSPLLRKFCNHVSPAPLVTSSHAARVHFHSNEAINDAGFQLVYAAIPGTPGCGGLYSSPSGEITSPNESGEYSHNMDCEWLIQLPIGERIKLTFHTFALESSHGCHYDFLEKRFLWHSSPSSAVRQAVSRLTADDGDECQRKRFYLLEQVYEAAGEQRRLLGRYCGTTIPLPFTSTSNEVLLHFHSDFSNAGEGFRITYEAICGGQFSELSGIVKSPYYPNSYPTNRVCIYEIQLPPGNAVSLHFQDFEVEDTFSPPCYFDYLEIRDGDNENAPVIGSYCGGIHQFPSPIISTYNYLWLKFVTDGSISNKGFYANYTAVDVLCGGIYKSDEGTITSPQHPHYYPPDTTCRWIISVRPGFVIQLTWQTFELEYGAGSMCPFDHVTVYQNSSNPLFEGLMGKYCGQNLPPVLTTVDNMMTIEFSSDYAAQADGFSATYEAIDTSRMCGHTYHATRGIIQSPGYPAYYPRNKVCTWVIKVPHGQHIKLNVTDFELERGRKCLYDYLELRNGGYHNSPLIGKYCGTQLMGKVIPSMSNQLYLHFVTDSSRSEKGFSIIWDGTASGCGGTLTAPTGDIQSPNYPEPYGSEAECFWKISVSQGSTIQIVFVDLELEQAQNCYHDYLELHDGMDSSAPKIGKYCTQAPLQVQTTGNHLYVKFRTDSTVEHKGFHIRYSAVCNNVVKGFHGTIESFNFPNQYPENLDCTWNITAPKGNKINVTFSHFELEVANSWRWWRVAGEPDQCRYDYLEVKEGHGSDPPTNALTGKLCGSNIPPPIYSTLDHVYVHFRTDNSRGYSGFRLEWVVNGCGGILEKPTGTLVSPGYPGGYPISTVCEWHIKTHFGYSIEITFEEFSLEGTTDCYYDSLKIYNGKDVTAPLLTTLCHRMLKPETYTSSGSNMFLRFESDASFSSQGFRASYQIVNSHCGGKFSAAAGNIHSPNYPNNYGPNEDCMWLLEVDKNHVVALSFGDFDLAESDTSCSGDYVKVYDGDSTESNLLLTHCGNTLPTPSNITSTANQLLVHMHSDNMYEAKGFRANYSMACGARIVTDGYGEIKTQEALNAGGLNENCSWIIIATDPDARVTLTFTVMDLGKMDDSECRHYFIEVRDGEDADAPLMGSYCGTRIPPHITSQGSAIFVRAVSRWGAHYGQFVATYSVVSSACGGNFTAEHGSFATPGYPNSYPIESECVWIINTSPGNRAQLSFSSFDIEVSDNCDEDYVEVRENDEAGPVMGIYCGNEIPSNITAANTIWVKFRSSGTGTANGFIADFNVLHGNELTGPTGQIASPLYPRYYIPHAHFTWRVTVDFGMAVAVTFRDFYVEVFGEECNFYLAIYDGYDETAPLLSKTCGSLRPDTITSTSNIIFIDFETSAYRIGSRFLLEWLQVDRQISIPQTTGEISTIGCGGIINLAVANNRTTENATYTLTSPGYPNGYDHMLNCIWIFLTVPEHHLGIRFNDMNLETQSSCYADYVEIYTGQGGQPDWKLQKVLCLPNATWEPMIETTNLMKVVFHTDYYGNMTGFQAKVETLCGGQLYGPNGVLDTENATHTVIYNSQCEWNVTVRAGKTIAVAFDSLNIPATDTTHCERGHLMLRNGGPESPFLGKGKFCGSEVDHNELETTGNHLYIKYMYSSMQSGKGFRLRYWEKSLACGGTSMLSHEQNTTIIKSPRYPQIPPPHTECEWIIMGPPGERLHLDFLERFDITFSEDCAQEFVEIRDGGTVNSRLIGRFCESMPSSQYSTGNILYVRFFTDVTDPRNGFKAQVSLATCGGTFRGAGVITSPSFPGYYPNNVNCTWRLIGPTYHFLELQFQHLSTPVSMNCSGYGRVSIYDTYPENETRYLMGNFCGNTKPGVLESFSNEVIVTFQSAPSSVRRTYTGFQLTFSSSPKACGGLLENPAGVFQSPGYPSGVEKRRYCVWSITVPKGRRIKLEILDFDVPEGEYRMRSRMALYDGEMHNAFMGYSNPTQLPFIIRTSGNKMKIGFSTPQGLGYRGFKARYSSDEPAVCGGDLEGSSGVIQSPSESLNLTSYNCQWNRDIIMEGSNGTITFALEKGTFGNRTVHPCYMFYSSLSVLGQQYKVLATYCSNVTTPQLINSPFANTMVMASQRPFQGITNFSMTYKVSECGGILSGPNNIITSPMNSNGNYKPNMDCAWALDYPEGSVINVTFLSLDIKPCSQSYIKIHNGGVPASPLLGRYCESIPGSFRSQSNKLWIEYHSGTESQGRGFNISLSSVTEGCGGILHHQGAILQSPNYPQQYPNNAECVWEIRVRNGVFINLQFLERFRLQNDCSKDYVEAFDYKNDNWESLGRRCGANFPEPFNSTGNQMKVVFRSNEAITDNGFKATFNRMCGGMYENIPNGQIISPGYPEHYVGRLKCNYTISAPGRRISIKFEDFSLESSLSPNMNFKDRSQWKISSFHEGLSPNMNFKDRSQWKTDLNSSMQAIKLLGAGCRYDSLTIYHKHPWMSLLTEMGKFCGRDVPPPMLIKNYALLQFTTDASVHDKGFIVTFSLDSCGSEIREEGILESPSHLGRYFEEANCTWVIVAPVGYNILLRFSTFYLEYSSQCGYDALKIYDGNTTDVSALLGTFCGNLSSNPPSIHSRNNMMTVRFLTDTSQNFDGFRATIMFRRACGGHINVTSSPQTIQPVSTHESYLTCSWRLTASSSQVVKLQVQSLNIQPCITTSNTSSVGPCSCAYLEVRDGPNPFAELIGRYCNSSFLPEVTSSSNQMWVTFVSEGTATLSTFQATVTGVQSVCGTRLLSAENQIQYLTSPGYPSAYPPNIRCQWQISASVSWEHISIHFVDFDLEPSERCTEEKLTIEDVDLHHGAVITEGIGQHLIYNGGAPRRYANFFFGSRYPSASSTFCGVGHPIDYYSQSSTVKVTFNSNPTRGNNKGFKLGFSLLGCTRNYTGIQGRIFITSHEVTQDCIMVIQALQNHTISLYFTDYSQTPSDQCSASALEVRDGPNGTSRLLERLCGYSLPNPIFSSGSSLWLHMRGNDRYNHLDITYTTTDQGQGCGGKLFNYGGVFTSPLYPSNYRNNSVCRWDITVPIGSIPALWFSVFDIGSSSTCDTDYIEIYDMDLDANNNIQREALVTRYCGGDTPAIHESAWNSISVRYHVSIHNGGTGWVAQFMGKPHGAQVYGA